MSIIHWAGDPPQQPATSNINVGPATHPWRGCHYHRGTDLAYIELNRNMGHRAIDDATPTRVVIIVSLGNTIPNPYYRPGLKNTPEYYPGTNVALNIDARILMTWADLNEMHQAIHEAREQLTQDRKYDVPGVASSQDNPPTEDEEMPSEPSAGNLFNCPTHGSNS